MEMLLGSYDFPIHEIFESIKEKRVSTKLGWSSQVSGQLQKLATHLATPNWVGVAK